METNIIKLFMGTQVPLPFVIDRDETIGDLKEAILVEESSLQVACVANIPDTKKARNEDNELAGSDTIQDMIDDHFQGSLPPRKIHIVIKHPGK